MKTFSDIFILEKNKRENKPVFLYTIYNYDGNNTNLNLAEYSEEISFLDPESDSGDLPTVFTPFPITFEYINEQSQGEVDEVKVSVGNVSRMIQAYLENYDLRGKKVRILQVFADILDYSDAYLQHIFYVDRWEQPDEQSVIFYLSSKFNVRDVQLPKRIIIRSSCAWVFKSSECGYTGSETVCNRTLVRCRELNNNERFGNFPSAGGKRMYI